MRNSYKILLLPFFAILLLFANAWGDYCFSSSVSKTIQGVSIGHQLHGHNSISKQIVSYSAKPHHAKHNKLVRTKASDDDNLYMNIAVVPAIDINFSYITAAKYLTYKSGTLGHTVSVSCLRGPPAAIC